MIGDLVEMVPATITGPQAAVVCAMIAALALLAVTVADRMMR